MSVCEKCGDHQLLNAGHPCHRIVNSGIQGTKKCGGIHIPELSPQTDAHTAMVNVQESVKDLVEQALVSGSTRCNKCGDESNSDPGLICGRSLAEETGLPVYCDGIYEGGDSHVVGPSPLRDMVIARAKDTHCDEECEIDPDTRVTKVGDGYWVTAHLWVPADSVE